MLPRIFTAKENIFQSIVRLVINSTIAILSLGFCIKTIEEQSLSIIWGGINSFQLIVNLSLLKMVFPAPADNLNRPLVKIATFDFLSQFEWQSQMFFYPEIEPLNPRLNFIGYGSVYFSLNLDTLYFTTLFTILLIILGYPIRFALMKSPNCRSRKTKKKNIESFTLRTLIESYNSFVLSLAINSKAIQYSVGQYAFLGV